MTKSVTNENLTVESVGMRREINWVNAFWIASAASTLVLLSIGSIAATIGTPSWLVWVLSTLIGFVQLFIYAEMSGMFPNHSGGASVYACETAMCYVSEFRNPEKDTIRAVTSSGLLGIIAFGLLPFTFLGVLGMATLKEPAFVAGDPQNAIVKMAQLTFGTGLGIWITIMLIMAVILSIVTGMAGASRTLYQSSVEWMAAQVFKSFKRS